MLLVLMLSYIYYILLFILTQVVKYQSGSATVTKTGQQSWDWYEVLRHSGANELLDPNPPNIRGCVPLPLAVNFQDSYLFIYFNLKVRERKPGLRETFHDCKWLANLENVMKGNLVKDSWFWLWEQFTVICILCCQLLFHSCLPSQSLKSWGIHSGSES